MNNTNMNSLVKHDWVRDDVMALFLMPFNDLLYQAASTHRMYFDQNSIQKSTLLSIKTGSCPEDCKYCPQSAHHNTSVKKEALIDADAVERAAKHAKESGASRFCMGAAWRQMSDRDLPILQDMVGRVKALGLETCMTLGMAKPEQLRGLKESGLDYYNHNIDTSEAFYDKIITTRTFQDRIDTLDNIQKAGLKTCCGGIVGLGEAMADRADMLMTLANLPQHPESVPINRLVRVEGTPLEVGEELDDIEFVRTIAVARIMLPKSYVRLSAGRESMSDVMQSQCFFAGANSIFYGDELLTTDNCATDRDNQLLERLGIETSVIDDNVTLPERALAQ